MKMLRQLLPLFVVPLAMALVSCETDSGPKKRKPVPPGANTELSNIPWNRPTSWEGSSRYGSMMPQSR